MDQMKRAFKGLFKGKKSKKEEPQPAASAETATPTHAKPTESTPAAPTPATLPEPVKTETTPATANTASAEPVAAPVQGEASKDEAAALSEVRKATQSRSTSRSNSSPQQYRESEAWNGARRRQKVALDNEWSDPI
jgi:hypothetical protein